MNVPNPAIDELMKSHKPGFCDYPLAFSVLDELKQRVGDMPVVCYADYPEFYQALKKHKLMGGVYYDVLNVPDVNTANLCMDMVRQYKV